MSYILDALKKSQAEQNAEGVSLATHATSGRKPRPRGLLPLLQQPSGRSRLNLQPPPG